MQTLDLLEQNTMELIEDPLSNSLYAISKKYLSLFSHCTQNLQIDRYHYAIILIDRHKEQLTQKTLTELLGTDKSYTVTIVDYLSEQGYVIREKNPADKREQLLKLTARAKTAIPLILEAISELNKQSFLHLTSDQIATFTEVLRVIQKNLSTSLNLNGFPDSKK